MDIKARALRTALETTARDKVIRIVQSFGLPPEEERFIIEREANRKSITQIALENHVSVETVKRRREKGFYRMLLELML